MVKFILVKNMISSVDNSKIKYLASLKQAKYRKSEKKFIVEGPHLVKEARECNVLLEAFSLEEKEGYTQVSEAIMKKLCNTDTVVSEIGLCKMLENDKLASRIILLDRVQDPGNVGTILRSAKAFSFDTVVLGEGCCDIYNDKVIRASQGAIFKLNFIYDSLPSFISNSNYTIYGTDVVNGIMASEVTKKEEIGIVLGNEGSGISDEVKKVIKKNIYIPIKNMESLNVSIAGGIIMYEISK